MTHNLNGEIYESVYLTEEEKFIIEQYRSGANVSVTSAAFKEIEKEEAAELLKLFPNAHFKNGYYRSTNNFLEKLQVWIKVKNH